LLPGRGFRYGAASKPNQAITSDQKIPWLFGCVVIGFVATAAVGQVVAMVALVAAQGNRRPWLLPGRGSRYGAASKPNQAITSDQKIPWLFGCVVVGFVATAAVGQVVAMVALVATEPTLVATDHTLVTTEATLGETKAAQADRFVLVHYTHLRCTLGSCN
jgi:hypothetical protein